MAFYWRFDETNVSISYDSVGDNDAELFNGMVWTEGKAGWGVMDDVRIYEKCLNQSEIEVIYQPGLD